MAYLAVVWHVFGYSILATRVAMLAAAAVAVWLVFLLAIELGRRAPGAPAFPAVLLLIVSPLFYTQAMMAQLDMPAMLLTMLALLLFLQNRVRSAALACLALVLVKETGLIAPLVFAGWLVAERRRREALWFLLPVLALGVWLAVLYPKPGTSSAIQSLRSTTLPTHCIRCGSASLWLGAAFICSWRTSTGWVGSPCWPLGGEPKPLDPLLARRRHAGRRASARGHGARRRGAGTISAAGAAADVHRFCGRVVLASVQLEPRRAGGHVCRPRRLPVLEPSLPLSVREQSRHGGFRAAAARRRRFRRTQLPGQTITTAWPLSIELRRPACGYVASRLPVREVPSFRPGDVAKLDPASVQVFVLFSRDSENAWDCGACPPSRR